MAKSPALLLSLALFGSALSCKKEQPPASYPQSPPPAYANPVPGGAAPGTPAPAPAPVTGAAAVGLPCTSEQDLQCAFAHCVAGRCGGCRSSAECKPGAQCLPSWLGYACFPSFAQTTTPAPTAAPAPAPLPTGVPVTPTASSDPLDALRNRCLQRTNEYRARASVAPIVRRQDREACADGEAQSDGASGSAHGAFGRCQEGAQNECPGWPGPLDQVIDKCLAQMFAEGPGPFAGHGHYLNMTAPSYTSVACGFATAPNGQIWIVQNFYR